MRVSYLLFGSDACKAYDEGGIEAVQKGADEMKFDFQVHRHDPANDAPGLLLAAYDGWKNYMFIPAHDYQKLTGDISPVTQEVRVIVQLTLEVDVRLSASDITNMMPELLQITQNVEIDKGHNFCEVVQIQEEAEIYGNEENK